MHVQRWGLRVLVDRRFVSMWRLLKKRVRLNDFSHWSTGVIQWNMYSLTAFARVWWKDRSLDDFSPKHVPYWALRETYVDITISRSIGHTKARSRLIDSMNKLSLINNRWLSGNLDLLPWSGYRKEGSFVVHIVDRTAAMMPQYQSSDGWYSVFSLFTYFSVSLKTASALQEEDGEQTHLRSKCGEWEGRHSTRKMVPTG
jgi:hypothetical protein